MYLHDVIKNCSKLDTTYYVLHTHNAHIINLKTEGGGMYLIFLSCQKLGIILEIKVI